MKKILIGTAVLGLCVTTSPAFAQGLEAAAKAGDKKVVAAPSAPPPKNPNDKPVKSPDETSHQAMVEEQERRDRAAEAERDRDDQG